jgi:hypothetical protein
MVNKIDELLKNDKIFKLVLIDLMVRFEEQKKFKSSDKIDNKLDDKMEYYRNFRNEYVQYFDNKRVEHLISCIFKKEKIINEIDSNFKIELY